jgi:hypothetical protein
MQAFDSAFVWRGCVQKTATSPQILIPRLSGGSTFINDPCPQLLIVHLSKRTVLKKR